MIHCNPTRSRIITDGDPARICVAAQHIDWLAGGHILQGHAIGLLIEARPIEIGDGYGRRALRIDGRRPQAAPESEDERQDQSNG